MAAAAESSARRARGSKGSAFVQNSPAVPASDAVSVASTQGSGVHRYGIHNSHAAQTAGRMENRMVMPVASWPAIGPRQLLHHELPSRFHLGFAPQSKARSTSPRGTGSQPCSPKGAGRPARASVPLPAPRGTRCRPRIDFDAACSSIIPAARQAANVVVATSKHRIADRVSSCPPGGKHKVTLKDRIIPNPPRVTESECTVPVLVGSYLTEKPQLSTVGIDTIHSTISISRYACKACFSTSPTRPARRRNTTLLPSV